VKIRARKNPSGAVVWQLDLGLVDGVRVRKSFRTRGEATTALVDARALVAAKGRNALTPAPVEHPTLGKWLARLDGTGKTLDDVFRWFFETYKEPKAAPPSQKLLKDYQAELTRLNRTEKYIRQSVNTLTAFFQISSTDNVAELTREAVLPFVTEPGYSPATHTNRLVTLKAFFEWCTLSGALVSNPLSGAANRIRIAKSDAEEIQALGVNEVQQLLATAVRPEHRLLLGWLALALFAGVRPDEIARTTLDRYHAEEGTLRITAKASKTSRTRVIDLAPAAQSWLAFWQSVVPVGTPFTVSGHRKRWDRLREDAGLLNGWVHDVLRHTFATMHYAAHQNAAQLKALMGHSQGEDTLFAHYRAVQTVSGETITRGMAQEFWKLTPETLLRESR